jgi:hypothetical protein
VTQSINIAEDPLLADAKLVGVIVVFFLKKIMQTSISHVRANTVFSDLCEEMCPSAGALRPQLIVKLVLETRGSARRVKDALRLHVEGLPRRDLGRQVIVGKTLLRRLSQPNPCRLVVIHFWLGRTNCSGFISAYPPPPTPLFMAAPPMGS